VIAGAVKSWPLAQTIARRPPLLYSTARTFLARYEEFDAEERARFEAAHLRRLLAAARGTRAYAGIQRWEDVPPLAKAEVRADPSAWRRRGVLPRSVARTSGTSGASLEIVRSLRNVVFEQACIDWVAAKAGVELSTARVVVLRGDQIKAPEDQAPPFWKASADGRTLVLSSNHLNASTFPAYEAAIREFRADVLYAYPSAAANLARLTERLSGRLRLPLVLTSSETLPIRDRLTLERVFGAATADYYGQAERVAFAWSTEPGRYFFLGAYGAVELPAGEDGSREVVGTAYANTAQLLLRYQTGDRIDLSADADARRVALGLEPFEGVRGRLGDVLYGPDGELFVGVDHIPRRFDQVDAMQFVQAEPDLVRILVQAAEPSDALREAVTAAARQKIGPVVRLELDFVDGPRKSAAGKAPFVIHEWKPEGV
jgi:phenylacetate-coenzyme A ligase PaaK-like adenylate-forming protein